APNSVIQQINAPKEFSASYDVKKDIIVKGVSYVALPKRIHVWAKGEKFYLQLFQPAQDEWKLVKEVVYNTQKLWLISKARSEREKDFVVRRDVSLSAIERGFYFWRLPDKRFPEPRQEQIANTFYYVFTLNIPWKGRKIIKYFRVDVVDQVVKMIHASVYSGGFESKLYEVKRIECEQIAFEEVPDGVFNYTPLVDARVESFQEAGNDAEKLLSRFLEIID
ncbi:hypothetical protein ACFL1E_07270, partial [Candidatus Omnitrophota bacterium]